MLSFSCEGSYCSPTETFVPHIAFVPHMAFVPHIALVPHMALVPHIAFVPHMALLPHKELLGEDPLLPDVLPAAIEACEVPVRNCDVPHTTEKVHADVVFHTEDGLALRLTVFVFPLNVAIGDIAVPFATSVLLIAASTST